MYRYDPIDQQLVDERVAQFRDQTARFLSGELSEEDFRSIRLQNGLYIQRHAPMLRVAIPYGELSSRQLRKLAHIARVYDRGYGHFSTRQNIQFNWPELARVPDILAELATVQMHAIQTSGNCVRNTTIDHLAGVAGDEQVDPRPYAELIRQWSTFHPEFAALPRKFKIALSGATTDRAVVKAHDIGINIRRDAQGEVGFEVYVGGGMGRTPVIGQRIREWLPERHLLSYLDSMLRVYNLYGRRDNKFKARIKILVRELGIEEYTRQVAADWAVTGRASLSTLPAPAIAAMRAYFPDPVRADPQAPTLDELLAGQSSAADLLPGDLPRFGAWIRRNTHAHRLAGHRAVSVSLKRPGVAPGDATADEMDAIASLAQAHSAGELRVTHEQNLLLPWVPVASLPAVWRALDVLGLARPNIGMVTNIIACPGGDFCDLANAKSLPIAQDLMERFDRVDEWFDIGPLDIKISGCINSCGHHHVGHIGVLGVDKHGEEWYQITIGGHAGNRAGQRAAFGKVIGPSMSQNEVAPAIERMIERYVAIREHEDETFIDVLERTGIEPFKESAYATSD
ncbi:MAG TPA: nitrite/sulfite reductase [Burkholderiaceae bacterium]|jgi:sulfite reductase (NADPH) hemoprotein beta-component|nr:nitrite/sulfite reductase [Burkholderiaceae bacterium]